MKKKKKKKKEKEEEKEEDKEEEDEEVGHREIVPPRETVAIAIVGRGG